MQIIPNYCRVMRVMREIPPEFLIAGTKRIDLRKDIESEIRKRKLKINEIRFREIGFEFRDKLPKERISGKLKLKVTKYKANGDEYFLEFVNKDNILFGLCRLRIENKKAIVREIHVYGQSLAIGEKSNSIMTQHRGLGKLLMAKAEEISKKEKCSELSVISGVGVREYYKKLGYSLVGDYMVKKL